MVRMTELLEAARSWSAPARQDDLMIVTRVPGIRGGHAYGVVIFF
jgi:hypothetical protein